MTEPVQCVIRMCDPARLFGSVTSVTTAHTKVAVSSVVVPASQTHITARSAQSRRKMYVWYRQYRLDDALCELNVSLNIFFELKLIMIIIIFVLFSKQPYYRLIYGCASISAKIIRKISIIIPSFFLSDLFALCYNLQTFFVLKIIWSLEFILILIDSRSNFLFKFKSCSWD